MRFWRWTVPAACCCLLAAATAGAACKVSYFAQIPVSLADGDYWTTALVDGHSIKFVVSNMAFYSSLPEATAQSIGFVAKPASNAYVIRKGKSGLKTTIGVAKELKFGSQTISDASFLVFSGPNQPADAFIGQNILARRDTEYNLGQGLIRLTKPVDRDCAGTELAYWAGAAPVRTVSLVLPEGFDIQMLGKVTVDGAPMTAMFDMNADGNRISPSALRRLAPQHVKNADDMVVVQALDIGGEVSSGTPFNVSAEDMEIGEVGYDLVIGRSFFLAHRIYVSPSRKALFFTANSAPAGD